MPSLLRICGGTRNAPGGHLDIMFDSPAGRYDAFVVRYARNAPSHPGKVRLLRRLLRAVDGGKIRFRLPGGATFAVPATDYIGHSILWDGSYEPASLALAARLVGEHGSFVDVGANFGLYAATLADRPGVTVLAIEPDAWNFLQLRDNCRAALGRNCTLLNAAVAASCEILPLELPVDGNLGTVRVAKESSGGILVSSTTLGAAMTAAGLRSVDLMKVDVEGFEQTVFAGCPFEGDLRPKNIVIEYTDYGRDSRGGWSQADIRRFFEDRGYVGRAVDGGDLTSAPIEHNAWFQDARLAPA